MSTLKILAIVAPVALALWLVLQFDGYTFRRFHHKFFTNRACALSLLIVVLLVYGLAGCAAASFHPSVDPLDGVLFVAMGLGVAAVMLVRNIRRTNLTVGLLGSALQVVLGPVAGLLLLTVLLGTLIAAKPVYVINR